MLQPITTEDEMKVAVRTLIGQLCDEHGWCDYGQNSILKNLGLAPVEGEMVQAARFLDAYKAGVAKYYKEQYEDGPGNGYYAIVAELEQRLELGQRKLMERRPR